MHVDSPKHQQTDDGLTTKRESFHYFFRVSISLFLSKQLIIYSFSSSFLFHFDPFTGSNQPTDRSPTSDCLSSSFSLISSDRTYNLQQSNNTSQLVNVHKTSLRIVLQYKSISTEYEYGSSILDTRATSSTCKEGVKFRVFFPLLGCCRIVCPGS